MLIFSVDQPGESGEQVNKTMGTQNILIEGEHAYYKAGNKSIDSDVARDFDSSLCE